ncbi:hypothetical protein [Methylophaga thiooxydans]|uniref:Glycosyltransferase RgtA/B/C/D-like domain-containing protein n=1 Tax=Methylophaga thiooxydans DMS010 TaxID=637616 RepID=C0N8S8_9GAMM|nr:hypothetical protein [Methylophaga thiooxydans]EEF78870.1 hypothetical protein MDMS009_2614 [Methylophaga thiooxydans DMS010]
MNTTKHANFSLSFSQIRLITALISLLLSAAAYYFDDIINRDGVMYMEMVQAYFDGGLSSMATIYDWPFFAMLTAWFSQLSGLPIELSANTLNSILFVVFTDALLLISHRLLPNLRQVGIAAVLILSFYSINDYRDFVIRDIGYWAFCSLALYQLMRYQAEPKLKTAIQWQVSALVAVLFRVEGIILLFLMPFFALSSCQLKSSIRELVRLHSLNLMIGVVLAIAALSLTEWFNAFDKVSDYLTYLNTEALQLKLDERLNVMEKRILSPFSADYSALILFSGLSVMLLYKLLAGVSGYYGLIWLVALKTTTSVPAHRYRKLLWGFLAVNILILLAFLFRQYFVVTRYCAMAIVGLFLLLLPKMTQAIEAAWLNRRYRLFAFFAFLVFAGFVDALHTTNSKSYIKNTAIWAQQNLNQNSLIATDDEFIQYYFKRNNDRPIVYHPQGFKNIERFDYLIRVEKKDAKTLAQLYGVTTAEIVYELHNRRGNKATIYKIDHHADAD